jgi:hypothetical protein
VNRDNAVLDAAWVTAANRQVALSRTTLATVERYRQTHSFNDPNRPTIEEFCRDCNGGRPIRKDDIFQFGIFQDPATGGTVEIHTFADGTFVPSLDDTRFPPHVSAPYSIGLFNVRVSLEMACILGWFVLSMMAFVVLMTGEHPDRILLGRWLVYVSFSLLFLSWLGGPADVARRWGCVLLSISALHLIGVLIFGREVDSTPRCSTCRYNLTGNTSGICPECGTPVDRHQSAPSFRSTI